MDGDGRRSLTLCCTGCLNKAKESGLALPPLLLVHEEEEERGDKGEREGG